MIMKKKIILSVFSISLVLFASNIVAMKQFFEHIKYCFEGEEISLDIFEAIEKNSLSHVKSIVNFDEKRVYSVDCAGNSPLHAACAKCDDLKCEIVKYLISKGAAVNSVNDAGDTPLKIAFSRKFYTLIKILLDNGAGLPEKYDIFSAIKSGSLEEVKYFVEVKKQGSKKSDLILMLPIQYAFSSGVREIIEYLIDNVDLNEENLLGTNVLNWAFRSCDQKTLELLVKKGAKISREFISRYGKDIDAEDCDKNSEYFKKVAYLKEEFCKQEALREKVEKGMQKEVDGNKEELEKSNKVEYLEFFKQEALKEKKVKKAPPKKTVEGDDYWTRRNVPGDK
jgi:Ankyrin repeat.